MYYERLSQAIQFYRKEGFVYRDAPWAITERALAITAPPFSKLFTIDSYAHLVASGEQSFLQLILDGKLPKGRYQTCTPCFRDDAVDAIHHRYFMKVELIDFNPDDKIGSLMEMIVAARHFFEKYVTVKLLKTLDGYDLVDTEHEIELGSYGIRSHPEIGTWVYGTGLAEPRLSQVIHEDFLPTEK